MIRHHVVRRLAAAGAAAAVALIGLGAPALADTTATDEAAPVRLSITADAGIQAGGVGAATRIEVKCPAGQYGWLSVEITQVRDGGVITGGGSSSVGCTGKVESIWVGMASYAPEGTGPALPFRLGKAFVSAYMESCFDICETLQDTRTLRLSTELANQAKFSHPKLTFKLPPTGQFEAFGAGVVVEIPYTCAAGLQGYFYATLGQVTDAGTVAYSSDDIGITCTETSRSGVMAFHARNAPWQLGKAFLTLGGDACDEFECVSGSAFRTLRVAL